MYKIAFKGLKEGVHQYEFDVDQRFFEKLEDSEIENGELKVEVDLTRSSSLMKLSVSISGTVEVVCDRCLGEFDYPIDFKGNLVVKFGGMENDDTDEVFVVSPDAHEIDLKQYIFESINLTLPLKMIHPENEDGESSCDPDVIEKLNNYIIEEENSEDNHDPRWDDLKNLMAN